MLTRTFFAVSVCLMLCSIVIGEEPITVEGTVSYQPRMGLPSDSVLRLKIADDSGRTDKASEGIANKEITLEHDQVPIPFILEIPKSKIEPGHTYTIQAQIEIKGRPWFKGVTNLPKEWGEGVKNFTMVLGPVH
jgi:uncharacterized lipoprotein YbaY